MDEVARLRVDSSTLAYQKSNIKYESSKELMETNQELRSKTSRLDSLKKVSKEKSMKLEALTQSLKEVMPELQNDQLETYMDKGYLHITLAHRVLFNKGENTLRSDGLEVIRQIAIALQDEQADIMILGHTDSIPYVSKGKDNWELSFERAHSVMQVLLESGLSADNIILAGRSQHDPTLDNESQIGRLLNRRIEFVLMPDIEMMESVIEEFLTESEL